MRRSQSDTKNCHKMQILLELNGYFLDIFCIVLSKIALIFVNCFELCMQIYCTFKCGGNMHLLCTYTDGS